MNYLNPYFSKKDKKKIKIYNNKKIIFKKMIIITKNKLSNNTDNNFQEKIKTKVQPKLKEDLY